MVVPRRPLRDAGRLRPRRRARHDGASPLGQTRRRLRRPRRPPVIWLDFPYREEPLRYDGSETPAPPDVRTYRWQPGESRRARVPRGRRRLAPRCSGSCPHAVRADAAWVSVDEAAALAAWGLHRWHYRPDPPRLLETVAFDRDAGARRSRPCTSPGSAARRTRTPSSATAAASATTAYVAAAEGVLDHVAANLTPGGTFWPQWTSERGWTWGWHPDHTRAHARTLADATLFMLRAGGRWDASARSNVEVALPHAARRTARCRRRTTSRPVTRRRGTARPACRGSPRSSRPATSRRRAAAGEYYARFDAWYGAPEDVDLAPTLRGRLRGADGVRRARGLGDRAPRRRLDADLPLLLRRRLLRDTMLGPLRLPDAAAPTRRRPRTSTSTRSG